MRYLVAFGLVLVVSVTPGQSLRERRGIPRIDLSGGLYGVVKNITFSETDSRVRIDCRFYNTSIWILDSFLSKLSIRLVDNIVFLDSNSNPIHGCTFKDAGDYHFVFNAFGKCAASIEDDKLLEILRNFNIKARFEQVFGGVITVRYKICIVPAYGPSQLIGRDVSTTIWLACVFNRTAYADNYYIKPLIRKVEVQGENQTGNIKISIRRYTNSNCTNVDVNRDVVIPSPVFVGIKLDNGSSTGLILQVIECWAQPTNLPGEARRYSIINQPGCAAPDSTLNRANMIYKNFEGITAKFSFHSFVWSNLPVPGQKIYVYCKVKVCESLVPGSTCTTDPTCVIGRRRRNELSAGSDRDEKIVGMDPIIIRTLPCDKVKLGCSHECAISKSGAEMCICPEGWTLLHDLKTCRESGNEQAAVVISSMPQYVQDFNVFDFMLMVLVGVVVLNGIFFLACRPKRRSSLEQKQAPGI